MAFCLRFAGACEGPFFGISIALVSVNPPFFLNFVWNGMGILR
jgi:hypothetical protein